MNNLLKLFKSDQKNTRLFKKGVIDSNVFSRRTIRNISSFLKTIEKSGFPKYLEDPNIYKMAITLLLHTPLVELKKNYNKIKGRTETSLLTQDKAYIIDRINILSNRKQTYGTNYRIFNDKIIFLPIKFEKNVDKRRRKMGLCSLSDYKKFIKGKRRDVNLC